MHKSIATIDSPEFINLQPLDINPLMSSCEIKVLYIGENRNHSFISKEVATEMAKTLRGAPIVGYYKEKKEDFADHGEVMVWDDEGIHFECKTIPYGFVSPDAQVWFKKFEDYDEFGNSIEREYLMTTGFLWTGQYEEAKLAIEDEGRPHSMELDENTINGDWATNYNTGMEFFIINDAIFSKLCILGEDVEPCFEGSSVTAPNVSASFTKIDDNFKQTLFSMMQDLRFALQGGKDMENTDIVETPVAEETPVVDNVEITTDEAPAAEDAPAQENPEVVETPEEGAPETSAEFAKEKDNEEKNEDKTEKGKSDNSDNETEDEKKKEDEEKYSLLEAKYSELEKANAELQTQFSELTAKYEDLVKFKADVEDKKKDELIKSFYMLDAEVIKDFTENKAKYSYEEIESKLSVLYAQSRFTINENNGEDNSDITTVNVESSTIETRPEWVLRVCEVAGNI